jgi:hypothetical protein
VLIDPLTQCITCNNTSVMPGRDRAFALEHRQMYFKPVTQRFVLVRIGEK